MIVSCMIVAVVIAMGFMLLIVGIALFIRLIVVWITNGVFPEVTGLALMFASIMGLQSFFFAMWFDSEYDKR